MSHLNVLCINFHSSSSPTVVTIPLSLSLKTHRKYLTWPTLQSKVGSVWACSHFHSYLLIITNFMCFSSYLSWKLWAEGRKGNSGACFEAS